MKKYIPEHKVKRMRNIVTKKYGNKTRIQSGFSITKEDFKEGDIWEERGKTWTIKNGIRQNITKLDKCDQLKLKYEMCIIKSYKLFINILNHIQ